MPCISDYSLIGNCRSAALVSKYGSIDWCCLPEFHSPAIFAAILDDNKGGEFSITPREDFISNQQYVQDTNVISTRFETNSGIAELQDAFVVSEEKEKQKSLFPDHEILRKLIVTKGHIVFRLKFNPRKFYGRSFFKLQKKKHFGIKFTNRQNSFFLQTNLDHSLISISDNMAIADFELNEGQSLIFSLSCTCDTIAIVPEINHTSNYRMQSTIDYWRNWINQSDYNGLFKDAVRRSALVLKLLTYAPSGAIIAAPSMSLPERIGGTRNWDYRYCWLRDASFTVRALISLGFKEEADAYMNWILHATKLTHPKIQIVYSVYGHSRLHEFTLPWLSGYKNSLPVRCGNGAYDQNQLDVYGEVLDAIYAWSFIVEKFDKSSTRFVLDLAKVICNTWKEPDKGIWEIRAEPRHHTHSKVMAWVGLDRVIKLAEKYKWKDAEIDRYIEIKKAIENEVNHLGYHVGIESYSSSFYYPAIDASSLVFSLVNFCPATDYKMKSTIVAIENTLKRNNLVYRYKGLDDGFEEDEGCFSLCSFWLAENYAKTGRLNEAVNIIEAFIKYGGETGLLSEEIDPHTNALLGNYPQGFSHIGLINSVLVINEVYQKEKTK